jgi:N utilization substance protein A
MGEITLSRDEMHRISLANDITKVDILDCIETEDRIVFVVRKGFAGFALGKNAKNLEKLRNLLKKKVRFVELDEDEGRFITNLFRPFKIESVAIERVGRRNVAKVEVNQREKSKIIGRNGRNISVIREIARRHSSIDDVQIL